MMYLLYFSKMSSVRELIGCNLTGHLDSTMQSWVSSFKNFLVSIDKYCEQVQKSAESLNPTHQSEQTNPAYCTVLYVGLDQNGCYAIT